MMEGLPTEFLLIRELETHNLDVIVKTICYVKNNYRCSLEKIAFVFFGQHLKNSAPPFLALYLPFIIFRTRYGFLNTRIWTCFLLQQKAECVGYLNYPRV